MLLPPVLHDRVIQDDLLHFVIEAVEWLSPEGFWINHR